MTAQPAAPPRAETAPDIVTFDFAALSPRERYKLLIGAVVPRPIALVTTGAVAGVKAGYIRDPNGILIELVELAPH